MDEPIGEIQPVYTLLSGCFKHARASPPDSTFFIDNKLELSQSQPSRRCRLNSKRRKVGASGRCSPAPGWVSAGCRAPPGRKGRDKPLLSVPTRQLLCPSAAHPELILLLTAYSPDPRGNSNLFRSPWLVAQI